jgi:hypothetical protein
VRLQEIGKKAVTCLQKLHGYIVTFVTSLHCYIGTADKVDDKDLRQSTGSDNAPPPRLISMNLC